MRSAFQAQMREALRVGKERHRNKMRSRNAVPRNENLWEDDEHGPDENIANNYE